MKKYDRVSIEMFHKLLEDKKTDHVLLFDQMMEHLCSVKSNKQYMRILKEIGKWVDEAREGYGMKIEWK